MIFLRSGTVVHSLSRELPLSYLVFYGNQLFVEGNGEIETESAGWGGQIREDGKGFIPR